MSKQPTIAKVERDEIDPYDPQHVERRWQERWRDAQAFLTPVAAPGRPDRYVFAACPFTSGKAHMGHVRSYTMSDAYARFCRAKGDAVLFSLGFDAFGLPSELGAIRNRETPRAWVERCVASMREQFDQLGYSFDWSREFITSDEDVYRWTQWLFLTLLERDLIYRDVGQVDWCASCETVLASLQVEDGRCWRCHQPVRLEVMPQWYLRVSAYTAENSSRMRELVGWNKLARGAQHAVIREARGHEVEVVLGDETRLAAFAPHGPDLEEAAFLALAPSDPALQRWVQAADVAGEVERLRATGWQRSDRDPTSLPVIETGFALRVKGVRRTLPIIVSPTVDMRFGATAILGMPAVDKTDAIVADKLSAQALATTLDAVVCNVRPATRFSVRDFPISRQRAWGAPIPLVRCERCGLVPVPVEDLPVRLPDLASTGTGRPLADDSFASCRCPRCDGLGRREIDTLDCHFDGLWFWMAPCVPPADRASALFEHPELLRWLPIDQMIWGADGGGYMFDIRMITKSLRDAGYVQHMDGEPFDAVLMHEMVRMEGRKMSKHLGNVVDPEELVERFGADALRLAVLYAAAPATAFSWSPELVQYTRIVLERIWRLGQLYLLSALTGSPPAINASTTSRRKLQSWCDAALRRVTEDLERLEFHKAVKNVVLLLEGIEKFERMSRSSPHPLEDGDREALAAALALLVRLMSPLAPHLAEELWSLGGGDGLLATMHWAASDQLDCDNLEVSNGNHR